MTKKQVLFLCTGNSCRSHMAEALVNHDLGSQWKAFSAGTKPTGYVHPLASQVLSELSIDLTHHHSKSAYDFRHTPFDLVITVCDNAAQDCPIWLGEGKVVHLPFPDPADATGSDEEKLAIFRQVRDDIRQQIISYLATV